MQRGFVSFIVVSLLASVLCACEGWGELLRHWGQQHHSPDETPPELTEPSIELAKPMLELGRGLVAVVSYPGLQIIDVREPTAPRIVSEHRVEYPGVHAFYRVEDRAILILETALEYLGRRSDVTASRENGLLVLNIDIHDPAHPALLDTMPLSGNAYVDSRLRRSAAGAELYILTSTHDSSTDNFVESLQLRDGRLSMPEQQYVQGQYHAQTALRIASADADWLVVEATQALEYLQVWRIDSGRPIKQRSIGISGYIFPGTEMPISDGVLRVPHLAYLGDDLHFVVMSFALGGDPDAIGGTPASGICNFADLLTDPTGQSGWASEVHFLEKDMFTILMIRDGIQELRRFTLDALGNCQLLEPLSGCSSLPPIAADDVSSRVYPLGSGLAAAVATSSGSREQALSLYGTTPQSCSAPLASIQPETHLYGLQSTRLGSNIATAADGTRETGLMALPCSNLMAGGSRELGCLQLVTYSDRTLTARANIPTHGVPQHTILMPNATLAVTTGLALNTYDLRRIDTPRVLGSVQLVDLYPALFGFGDYVVRIRASEVDDTPDQIEVLPLMAASDRDPVLVRTEAGRRGSWLQVGDLLVKVERAEAPAHYAFQVYDLSDPVHPRRAGRLETDQVAVGPDPFQDELSRIRAVGGALLYPHQTADDSLAFDVIDFRDPDAPVLAPVFSLQKNKPEQQWLGAYVSGSKLYQNIGRLEPSASKPEYSVRVVDFADPGAPQPSPNFAVPAPVKQVVGHNLYTQTDDFQPATVTRVFLDGATANAQATLTLPDHFGAAEIETDSAGHLYALYRRATAPSESDPAWTDLSVLDEQTLEVLATLPIDSSAVNPHFSNGRLFVEGPGVAYIVDVRDPSQPRLQSYIRHNQTDRLLMRGDHVFAYGDYGVQAFDATAANFP